MTYLITIGVMVALVFAWVMVQTMARQHAERHPEFGPLREEGAGCGCGNHRCGESQCKKGAN
ncbi:MAG: chemotaxis protein [Nitrosomonadales bacterium]|nr:chemotaxis protein [Nitrosomonadales bacterium]